MTHVQAAAILAAQAPRCPFCGAPGRLVGDGPDGAQYQCQHPGCTVRGSWTEDAPDGAERENR